MKSIAFFIFILAQVDKKTATPFSKWPRTECDRSGQRENEHAVAALRVDLHIAAGSDRDVLLAVDHVRHGGRVDAGAAIVFPQLLAVARVERLEPAVRLAVEHEVS